MAISVNTIPSINIPFTDSNGRISPIWHEFLRGFVAASVQGTISENAGPSTIVAGAGLTEEVEGTFAVGAGNGITVNANDVNVDIRSQTNVQANLDDEVLISDVSDNNAIRKTTVRSMAELASNPGGLTTQVQYNSGGVFGGDSGFTYDGSGTATLSTALNIGSSVNIVNGVSDTIHFDGVSGSSNARMQSDGGGGFTLYSKASGADEGSVYFRASVPWISVGAGSGNSIQISSLVGGDYGVNIIGTLPLRRCMHENVTASTTQTQGQQPLTGDYCNIITVANANNVVTLPAAFLKRYCLVRNAGANTLQVFPASGDDLGNGVNVSTTIRPGEHATWFAIDSTTWHQIAGLERRSVLAGITASTTQTQGQQPLTKDVNEISVVANLNDTVTLPTAPAYSRDVTIINNGANILKIYPATGDDLGAGVNTSTTLLVGANVTFTNFNATTWVIT